MALARRTGKRTEANIWAGFVDAMTALLLVMIFVLSIFMIMQFMLRETIEGQGRELASLESQIASISEALGATRRANDALEAENAQTQSELEDATARLENLQFEFNQQAGRIADFETQVASLLARQARLEAERNEALNVGDDTQKALEEALSEKEAAELALAAAREAISQEEADAKLAEARADALQALIDDMQVEAGDDVELRESISRVMALANAALGDEEIAQSESGIELRDEVAKLSDLEQERLAEQVAIDYLRERLKNSDTEITAMTLALEEERKKAEDSLTLLAALQNERNEVEASSLSEAEKNAALLEIARREIAARDEVTEEDARRIALLNQQTANLRSQLNALQGLLDAAAEADAAANVQIEALGSSVNAALARVAAQERARANDLENYRSEFFGNMRQVLEGVDGIEVVGDRFVFSSEVLFPVGSAQLSADGQAQISKIGNLIQALSNDIPAEIPWIIRVDGHTDSQPLSGGSRFRDNWELSQARALSVVRYMIDVDKVDPARLAPTGFGEYHPIDLTNTPQGLARNRRIEFKLTEE